MPLGELRARVEEAEKLLRVAKQLARDELGDPNQTSRVRDRIGSIVSEVQGMFPGLGEPEAEPGEDGDDADEAEDAGEEPERAGGFGAHEELEAASEADTDSEADGDAGELGEEDEDEEWELDCDKLRAALANDALMAQIPEADRPRFRAMAERLLEVHERGELYTRILAGFEELAEVTRIGAESVQRQLAALLTFGGRKSLSDLAPVSTLTSMQVPMAMLEGTPKYKA